MIDLTNVKIIAVDGSEQSVDLSKDIAAQFYNNAQNVEEASASMDLFKNGKCEYSDALKNSLINLLGKVGYTWPVRQGVIAALDV